MNFEPMQLAWAAYLGGSVILLALFWWATSGWKPPILARLLRVWLMILVLVPAYADPEGTYLAPAWAVTFFVAAGEGIEAARVGYWPLLSAWVLGTAVLLAGAIVLWSRRRRATPAAAQSLSKA